MKPQPSFTIDTRGQSYTIGTVLILAMALVGTIGSAAAGYVFLDGAQDQAREDRATHAMSELNSEISLVALDNSAQSSFVNFERTAKESIEVKPGGNIRIETIDETDGTVEEVVVDREIGSIEYQIKGSDRSVAYQAGGVWKANGNGNSQMVSPPEIHYRGGTLTMPLILVNADESVSPQRNNVQVNHHSNTPVFPTNTKTNPIDEGQIKITVQSKYYQGWAEFFEKRIGGTVEVNAADQETTIILEAPDETESVTSGLSSTHSGSGITIRGGGGEDSFIDSYDSAEGPYTETQSNKGELTATSDVVLRGGANVFGDVIIPPGYTVDARGGSEVTGEIINEEVNTASVDQQVRSEITDAKNANNNAEAEDILNNHLVTTQSEWTLTEGTYYLDDDLELNNGDTLNIDSTDGEVKIAVDGDIEMNDAEINVADTDESRVQIYMKGDELDMSGSTVHVPGDKSSQMWIYAQSGLQASLSSGTSFTGVIYAPDDSDGDGETNLQSQATVYGGIVGGQATMRSGGVIHYDKALIDQQVFEESTFSPVTYMHISVNEVTISDENE